MSFASTSTNRRRRNGRDATTGATTRSRPKASIGRVRRRSRTTSSARSRTPGRSALPSSTTRVSATPRFFNSIGTLSAFTNDVVGELNIPNQNSGDPVTWGIPHILSPGTPQSATSRTARFAIDNNTLQFVDKLTWQKGSTPLVWASNTIGRTSTRSATSSPAAASNSRRTRRKAPRNTGGNAFAEFLLGDPFRSSVAVAIADGKFERNVFHAFVDDTWKVTTKFTVPVGLRYELTPPFTNTPGTTSPSTSRRLNTANPPQSNYPMFVRQGDDCTDLYAGLSLRWTNTPVVCAGFGLNNNLLETKYKNFAPRLGCDLRPGRQDRHP